MKEGFRDIYTKKEGNFLLRHREGIRRAQSRIDDESSINSGS